MTAPELNTRRWRTLRASLIQLLPPVCWICHEPVDKTLSGRHRMGPTIDHIKPRSLGGSVYSPSNCALSHQKCNAGRGSPTPLRSREW